MVSINQRSPLPADRSLWPGLSSPADVSLTCCGGMLHKPVVMLEGCGTSCNVVLGVCHQIMQSLIFLDLLGLKLGFAVGRVKLLLCTFWYLGTVSSCGLKGAGLVGHRIFTCSTSSGHSGRINALPGFFSLVYFS